MGRSENSACEAGSFTSWIILYRLLYVLFSHSLSKITFYNALDGRSLILMIYSLSPRSNRHWEYRRISLGDDFCLLRVLPVVLSMRDVLRYGIGRPWIFLGTAISQPRRFSSRRSVFSSST